MLHLCEKNGKVSDIFAENIPCVLVHGMKAISSSLNLPRKDIEKYGKIIMYENVMNELNQDDSEK